ncbi:hypothetical protein [Nitratidesulfovibrio vulgaris]|nr:hypothetical protein [Nitratidesulfovibrio vulgaris]WCB46329.1 hypothetical protein PH214_14995 [Nitratidesulfovibrio vulgaris]
MYTCHQTPAARLHPGTPQTNHHENPPSAEDTPQGHPDAESDVQERETG